MLEHDASFIAELRGVAAWGSIGVMAAMARLGWKYKEDDTLPSTGLVVGTITMSVFMAIVSGWLTSWGWWTYPSWQASRYALVALVAFWADDVLEHLQPIVLHRLSRLVRKAPHD